jgi:hypothetical protein
MSQLSTTKTLCMGMSTPTSNLYVLSHIGPRYRGMSYTTSEYSGKEEPEQSECSVDFNRNKG